MAPTYDFNVTERKIILRALRLCGAIEQGEDPTPEQVSEAAEALESLVKYLQSLGVLLWTSEARTVALAAGTSQYNLATDTLSIQHATVLSSDGRSTRVGLVEESVFVSVSEPTKQGRPEMALVEMREQPYFSVWPVPDATYTFGFKAVRKGRDFDNALGTPEMPQRWFDPLVYSLAANLADEYQLPSETCQRLTIKAAQMRETCLNKEQDPADTIYVNPI